MRSPPSIVRVIDVTFCLLTLPIALPLCGAFMIAIRLESAGPALFVQSRVGRFEKSFRMLKLRTMATGTADLPSHQVGSDRITPLGRILRQLKLDELPQLLNVLAGSMTLVGPRPCLFSQGELIEARRAKDLFKIRPGVTGPAQLQGVDMSEPERLAEIEAAYFSKASTRDHILLVIRTIAGGGSGDAAIAGAAASRSKP